MYKEPYKVRRILWQGLTDATSLTIYNKSVRVYGNVLQLTLPTLLESLNKGRKERKDASATFSL